MNNKQGNYFRMFLGMQDFLNEQTAIWSPITVVVKYKNNLDEIISRIAEKSALSQEGVGIKERKDQLRSVLALKLSNLSGVLQAFAVEMEDADLANAVKANRSELLAMKESEVDPFALKITGVAQKNMDALVDYGITESYITEILTTLADFNQLIGKPRSILNQKYVTLESLDELINEGNTLLREKIDKIMLMFRERNPEFYKGYERARTIVDA